MSSPKVAKHIIIGWGVAIVFFACLLLWAFLARIDSAAIAPGSIVVAGDHRLVQHYEGGIIKNIYVKNGSLVKKGMPLIDLETTQAGSQLTALQLEYDEVRAVRSRLRAELNDQSTVTFPERLLKNTSSRAQRLVEQQRQLFHTNKQKFLASKSVYVDKRDQLENQIEAIQSQKTANEKQLTLIKKELKNLRILEEHRLIKQSRLLTVERDAVGITGQIGKNKADIAAVQQKISETSQQLTSMIQGHQQDLLKELYEVQAKVNGLRQKIKSAEDILKRTTLVAPVAGRVIDMQVHTIGGVIKPGQVLLNIVPVNEELVVSARINPLDIEVVHAGLNARIRLTSLKARTTPFLMAKVKSVSPDTYKDEYTGQEFYRATLTIDQNELKKIKEYKLTPGMPVEVMIITDQLTPWDYLTDPISRSFDKAFVEQ